MDRPVADPRALAASVHAAALHLLRHVRAADRTLSMGPARASALSVLVFGGARSLGALALAEQVTPATMSRMVAGLVRAGLVERRRDPADARRLRLAATARARRLLEEGRSRRLERLAALLAPLTPDERRVLARAAGVLERELRKPSASAASPRPRAVHRRR